MNLSNFKSGIYRQQYQYKSFLPEKIFHQWEISDSSLIDLLSIANLRLGELNAFSQLIPDVDFFIKMHINKEATVSSRIEGTQTNITEVLQKQKYIEPERRDDWSEVRNYIKAMNEAIKKLKVLPLSNRLLKETHFILLQGVRGLHKLPGEFRSSQNWIGGASINDAVFIPPHHEDVPELMSDLEKFINDSTHILPDLLRIGIAHYQFETIHPFLDGNGRIGRLLITLYLVNSGLLVKPTLYLSDFFEKNKILYYDNLTRVRINNDIIQWLKFFLEGVKQTAESSTAAFKSIILLRQEVENDLIPAMGRKIGNAKNLVRLLYSKPVVDNQDVSSHLSMNPSTSLRLIEDFLKMNILKEITGYKRNRIFIFERYLKLFE